MSLFNIQALIDEKLASIEAEISGLKTQKKDLEDQIKTEKAATKAANDKVTSLTADVASRQARITELEGIVTAKESEATTLKARISALETEVTTLKARIAVLEAGGSSNTGGGNSSNTGGGNSSNTGGGNSSNTGGGSSNTGGGGSSNTGVWTEGNSPTSWYPDATTAGAKTAGVTFTTISGTHVPKANTVYQNMRLSDVSLNAKNVTYKNCIFSTSAYAAINYPGDNGDVGSGLKVIDCTFDGKKATKGSYAIVCPTDATITGCDFYGWENAMMVNSRNVVTDNYIHDLLINGADPHYDGIACQGGQDNVLIEHNTIISWDTSGVFIKADWGNINNIRIFNNIIKCQAGKKYSAAIYIYGQPNGKATNVQIRDNKCEVGAYRYYFSREGTTTGLVYSGNKDITTGANIDGK